jgi:hypothetical protein
MTTLRNRFRFFLEHAGYSAPPGRAACALQLAKAEAKAERVGLVFEWEDDSEAAQWEDERGRWHQDPAVACLVYCDAHLSRGPRREVLASLGAILESDDFADAKNYRRVVEAELAAEVFASYYSSAWLDGRAEPIGRINGQEVTQ